MKPADSIPPHIVVILILFFASFEQMGSHTELNVEAREAVIICSQIQQLALEALASAHEATQTAEDKVFL